MWNIGYFVSFFRFLAMDCVYTASFWCRLSVCKIFYSFFKLFMMSTEYPVIKSTQYKKLAPNALRFTYQNLKSCKSHEKNETKNIRPLVFSVWPIDLAFWCFLFCFFLWFTRFQILICEPQSICRKLLALSWLYIVVLLW